MPILKTLAVTALSALALRARQTRLSGVVLLPRDAALTVIAASWSGLSSAIPFAQRCHRHPANASP